MKMKTKLSAKLIFNDGIAVYIGKGISANYHKHYALEIILSFEKTFEIITATQQVSHVTKFAIVPKNIKHRFIGAPDDFQVFIFIDPFHYLGRNIEHYLKFSAEEVIVNVHQTVISLPSIEEWHKTDDDNFLEIISDLVKSFTKQNNFNKKFDERVIKSLMYLSDNLHTKIALSDAAKIASLSNSRYAHLFRLQTGIPFRNYILWLRIQKAVQSIISGNSLTQACYDAGFTDLPHFTKVFYKMFGVTPSSVLKS